MSWLEPWVLLRLFTAGLSAALFTFAALVAVRILRHGHLREATEGQLALERQAELASTLVRVAAVVQVLALIMSAVAADRLSGAIRGAMCGYGVVEANPWGWPSLASSLGAALAAGVLLQLLALDRRVRGLDLMKPIALGCVAMAPLALADGALATAWLGRLDLTVVASCCSTTLGSLETHGALYRDGPRLLSAWGALIGVPLAIAAALFAGRRTALVGLAGAITLAVLPLSLGAVVLEVAPHVYEVPTHLCPFCLLKRDAYFLGYPLFGAIFLAVVWGAGTSLAAPLSRGANTRLAFAGFARSRMTRQAAAWAIALVLGSVPVVLYAVASQGASLFR
jgi:hypothetical protein